MEGPLNDLSFKVFLLLRFSASRISFSIHKGLSEDFISKKDLLKASLYANPFQGLLSIEVFFEDTLSIIDFLECFIL